MPPNHYLLANTQNPTTNPTMIERPSRWNLEGARPPANNGKGLCLDLFQGSIQTDLGPRQKCQTPPKQS